MARTVLMCSPEHFSVDYQINPWMDVANPPNQILAAKQWQELYDVYAREIGWEVELVQPRPGLPDMVFTANGGLVHEDKVVLPNFRYPQRQPETSVFEEWFRRAGYNDIYTPQNSFEGEGDALLFNDYLFVGHPFRTAQKAHGEIAEFLNVPVVSLELRDPYFYHLDTCMSTHENIGAIAIWPGAFTSKSLKKIYERSNDVIEASEQDAKKFGLNAVCGDGHVVMNKGVTVLKQEYEDRGLSVHEVDISEFIKAGGGNKCLTLVLRGLERSIAVKNAA